MIFSGEKLFFKILIIYKQRLRNCVGINEGNNCPIALNNCTMTRVPTVNNYKIRWKITEHVTVIN